MMFRLWVVAFLVSSILAFYGATSYSQPSIEFKELTYDWGRLIEGDRTTHTFHFQNTGNEDLKIEKVKSS